MKKRILSLVLATLLIAAMAIPAAAYTYSGTFNSATGSCTYTAYGNCTSTGWSAHTEWTGSTDSYRNYIFQTDVTPYIYENGNVVREPVQQGVDNLRMGSNYSGYVREMHSISCEHYINGTRVEGPCVAYPG